MRYFKGNEGDLWTIGLFILLAFCCFVAWIWFMNDINRSRPVDDDEPPPGVEADDDGGDEQDDETAEGQSSTLKSAAPAADGEELLRNTP